MNCSNPNCRAEIHSVTTPTMGRVKEPLCKQCKRIAEIIKIKKNRIKGAP